MKRLARLALSLCVVMATAFSLVGCSGGGEAIVVALPYSDTIEEWTNFYDITEYNKELFYRNDMEIDAPDLHVIRINDGGEYDGQFFMYATGTNAMSVLGFDAYRSVDGVTWIQTGPCFEPVINDWPYARFWAPEVVYDADADREQYRGVLDESVTGKGVYYMFFTACHGYDGRYANDKTHPLYDPDAPEIAWHESGQYRQAYYVACALSTTPNGPFKLYTNSKYRLKADHYKSYSKRVSEFLGYGNPEDCESEDAAVRAASQYELNPYYNPNKREIRNDDAFLDQYDYMQPAWENGLLYEERETFTTIDASPFVDPKTGDKYLYTNRLGSHYEGSYIIGLKIGGADDDWTADPEMSTLSKLTTAGYLNVSDEELIESDLNEGGVNEGPHMIYNESNGKYYLTLSVNGLQSKYYAVVQAIGDTPLGPFTKLSSEQGGYIVHTEGFWDWAGGTGHHSFCKIDGELYIFFHAHRDRVMGGGDRGANVSKVIWTKNGDGVDVMYSTPTLSLQPRFGDTAKYKNIAPEAEVRLKNETRESKESYINDELISLYSFNDFVKDAELKKGKSCITLSFDDYRTLRAIMVHQGKDVNYGFKEVTRVELDIVNDKGVAATAYIDHLAFDEERYLVYNEDMPEESYYRGACSAIAEFDEVKAKEVRIYFESDTAVRVAEVKLLGI